MWLRLLTSAPQNANAIPRRNQAAHNSRTDTEANADSVQENLGRFRHTIGGSPFFAMECFFGNAATLDISAVRLEWSSRHARSAKAANNDADFRKERLQTIRERPETFAGKLSCQRPASIAGGIPMRNLLFRLLVVVAAQTFTLGAIAEGSKTAAPKKDAASEMAHRLLIQVDQNDPAVMNLAPTTRPTWSTTTDQRARLSQSMWWPMVRVFTCSGPTPRPLRTE